MVEADNTFIGGREENKHANKRNLDSQREANRVAVMGLMERLTAEALQAEGGTNVRKSADLMTDETKSYCGLNGDYHHTAKHSAGLWVKHYFIRTDAFENAWSLFKQQMFGFHYFITAKHSDRDLSEFTFRFNRHATGEDSRVDGLIAHAAGRLTYKVLIA